MPYLTATILALTIASAPTVAAAAVLAAAPQPAAVHARAATVAPTAEQRVQPAEAVQLAQFRGRRV